MVSSTDFSDALSHPHDVVQTLFEKHGRSNDRFEAVVADHFRRIFGGRPANLAKIPSLTSTSSTPVDGSLVRFRCMVQDTGVGNEVYLGLLGSGPTVRCGMFGAGDVEDEEVNGEGTMAGAAEAYDKLKERQVVYAVEVPAETEWARRAWEARDLEEDEVANGVEHIHLNGSTSQAASERNPSSYAKKFPIAGKPHVGALVKIYDLEAAEKLRTTDVVEFVGIMGRSIMPNANWQDAGPVAAPSASQPGASTSDPSLLPCVHAIFFEKLPPATFPPGLVFPSLDELGFIEETRASLLEYLKTALGGDELAAEFVLLQLLSRIHARRSGLAIGRMSLNLSNFPSKPSAATTPTSSSASDLAPPSSESLPTLSHVLSTLLASFHHLSLSLSHLNHPDVSFYPKSKDESLDAGELQLPEGTTVIVDEAGMDEGNLQDGGVRNVRALASTLSTQKLEYAFPFSSFEFDTDLGFIVLSNGKSFLPIDCHLPLSPAHSSLEALFGRPSAALPTTTQLNRFRALLLGMRHKDLSIPDDISEHIQQDFVQRRQAAAGANAGSGTGGTAVTQEDLLFRMTLARLLAFSYSKTVLDIPTWERAVQLDELRKERIKAASTWPTATAGVAP